MPASFLDSNIVLYSLAEDDAKQQQALALLASGAVISTQVLSEVANVMRRKLGYEHAAIRAVLLRLISVAQVHPVASSTILLALDISARYGFSFYDSQILAAAQEAGCPQVYSEDMQHGQVLDAGLTIINPWSASSAGAKE